MRILAAKDNLTTSAPRSKEAPMEQKEDKEVDPSGVISGALNIAACTTSTAL